MHVYTLIQIYFTCGFISLFNGYILRVISFNCIRILVVFESQILCRSHISKEYKSYDKISVINISVLMY